MLFQTESAKSLLSAFVYDARRLTSIANKQQQAGGNVGTFITKALLETGKHTVTALTRPESSSTIPAGVDVKKVNHEEPQTLVDALRGQEALVVTLSGYAPIRDIEEKLVRAAGEAGVPWM